MAKTVFGMPGVGKEQKGGDAVAPQGTTGSKTGQALPQKQGRENPKGDSQGAGKEKTAPKAPPTAAPLVKPAPSAKVAPAPPKGGPATPSGNKTMFGMPAMKLPQPPGAGAAPGGPPQQPKQPAGGQTSQQASGPQLAEEQAQPPVPQAGAPDTADAFKATELGMPPAEVSDSPPPPSDEPAPQMPDQFEPEPQAEIDSGSWASEASGIQSVRQGATGGGGKAWIWIVLGSILVVLAAIGIAVYFLVVRPASQASEELLRQLPIQQGAGIAPTMPAQPAQPVQPALQPGQAPPQPTPTPQQ